VLPPEPVKSVPPTPAPPVPPLLPPVPVVWNWLGLLVALQPKTVTTMKGRSRLGRMKDLLEGREGEA
jgi:hypothetical protein